MKRNIEIDSLRSIATVMVIFIHIAAYGITYSKETSSFETTFWIANFFDSFSRVCVPIFVLIIGRFILNDRELRENNFLSKRVKKILFYLLIWGVFYLIYKIVGVYLLTGKLNVENGLNAVFLGKPYYHLWYLFMVAGLFLMIPVLKPFVSKISIRTYKNITAFFLIYAFTIGLLNLYFGSKDLFVFWFLKFLGYFLLGGLSNRLKLKFKPLNCFLVYLTSSLIIFFLSYYTLSLYNNLYFYTYTSPFVIVGAISLFVLFLNIKLRSNLLNKIAPYSLGIYLLHPLILDLSMRGLSLLNVFQKSTYYLNLITVIILVPLISTLMVIIIRKIPILKKTL